MLAPEAMTAKSLRALLECDGLLLPIVDLRPEAVFQQQARLIGSANVPLEYLTERLYVLPDRNQPMAVVLPGPQHYRVLPVPGSEASDNMPGDDSAAISSHPAATATGGTSFPVPVYLRTAHRSCDNAQAFLEGWGSALRFVQASPELWTAASEARLLDPPHMSLLQLRRRWLFRPSPLLEAEAERIERLLIARPSSSNDEGIANSATGISCGLSCSTSLNDGNSMPAAANGKEKRKPCCPGRSARTDVPMPLPLGQDGGTGRGHPATEPARVLRCLDVGCGSGRDLAWLAVRGAMAQAAATAPVSDVTSSACGCPRLPAATAAGGPASGSVSGAGGKAALPAGTAAEAGGTAQPCSAPSADPGSPSWAPPSFVWHVAGLDSNLGALRRARQLLRLADIPASHISMHHGEVDAITGDLRPHAASAAGMPTDEASAAGGECEVQDLELMVQQDYDLILCIRFLERSFLPCLAEATAPGGLVAYSTFMDLPGTRSFGRPATERHLLQKGELASRFFGPAQGFEVLRDDIGLAPDGRELSMFLAQKKL